MNSTNKSIEGLQADSSARIEHTDETIIVTLSEPLTYRVSRTEGERTVEQLTITKKIKGRHLLATDKAEGEMGKSLALLAALAGVPHHAVLDLPGGDIELCLEAVEAFLPGRRFSNDSAE